VRIVHGWQESSASIPPPAPNELQIRGGVGSLRLTWNQRPDADHEPVVDYQVQVSDDFDMRFPLGPNFDRMLFSGRNRWSIPNGAFTPFEDYYFRVRGRDRWGAWSDWSTPLQMIYDPYASRDGKRVIGDSDLDGEFTTADLVLVFQRGHYEDRRRANSRWTDGDWNGDREFDSSDLVELLRSGEWTRSRTMRAEGVPEPSGQLLTVLAVLGLAPRALARRARTHRAS
jgi:hypothetical protein